MTIKNNNLIIYDFDGTIYSGDAMIDFWIYSLKRHPKTLLALPKQILGLIKYKLKIINKDRFKETFLGFTKYISKNKLQNSIKNFWELNRYKIYPNVLNNLLEELKENTVIIISASPEFILDPIKKIIPTDHLICTNFDIQQQKLISKNCINSEKVVRLNQWLKEINARPSIKKMYSDSLIDKPLFELAAEKYLIKKGTINKLQ